MIRTFKYTKTGVKGLVERKVIVLNEDANRIGGLEVTGVPADELAKLEAKFQNVTPKGFGRRAPGEPKPEYADKLPYQYRAFSKSKIAEFNR